MAPKLMHTFSVFICDDDAITRNILHYQLSKLFEKNKGRVEFHIATNIAEARALIAAQQRIDLCFQDVYLPDGNGLDLLKEIKRNENIRHSIIMTAHSEEALAIRALKMGASDYLKKPLSEEDIQSTFAEYLKSLKPDENKTSEQAIHLIDDNCFSQLKKLQANNLNFIISGEAGSGKSTLMDIFTTSKEVKDIYCWTLTNSDGNNKDDLEVMAREFNGLIKLHDLETLSLKNQKKLLLGLKSREVSDRPKLRLLSTSSVSLQELINQDCFLPELYNYLAEAEIQAPSLRAHPDKIESYAHYFAEQFAKNNKEQIREISPCFISKIKNYDWPGNIRELQNFMRKILLTRDESPLIWHAEDKRYFLDIKLQDKTNSLKNIELDHIKSILDETKNNYKKAAEKLGISRSTLYRKMKSN
jgi:DNA-binding NtrC family response regulator